MFLSRIALSLRSELFESPDHAETCIARFDDIIDVTVACGLVRVAEQVVVFLFLFFGNLGLLGRVLDFLDFLGVQYGYCSVGTHHCDVC